MASLQGKKVVLAEDNSVNEKIASMMLTSLGMSVTHAVNGIEVIEKLKQGDYDLVLMDIQMPEMDGIEAFKIIRDPNSEVRRHDIPVVAVTAYAMESERPKYLEMGMDEFIAKPLERNKLEKILTKILA